MDSANFSRSLLGFVNAPITQSLTPLGRSVQQPCNGGLRLVLRRIRHGLGHQQNNDPKLTGTVEADETYVGGKKRHVGMTLKRGYDKAAVFGVVEGDVRFRMLERVTYDRLRAKPPARSVRA